MALDEPVGFVEGHRDFAAVFPGDFHDVIVFELGASAEAVGHADHPAPVVVAPGPLVPFGVGQPDEVAVEIVFVLHHPAIGSGALRGAVHGVALHGVRSNSRPGLEAYPIRQVR